MKLSYAKKSIALLSLSALAACSGGGAGGSGAVLPSQGAKPNPNQQSILSRIVGVGDSLTAGYQADGFLGATDFKNPLYPGQPVRPTQESGWWTLLNEQASGTSLETAIDDMYDPAKSPLPLIAGPGLDNQIVPEPPSSVEPIGQYKGTDACTYDRGFNQSGFLLRASARVRMDPNATTIRNVGVPGITLHEVITIHQPQTDTCSPLPGIPGLLSDVVSEESGTFWPVLRNFTKLGGNLTEVNAAASVHPTLATVWLGANDVLKYMGSGGRFVGGDRTVAQVESDLRATISTLQHAGAKVVVANLPNIVEIGYLQRVTVPSDAHTECRVQTFAYCTLELGTIQGFVNTIAKQYALDTPNGCVPTSTSKPCGYLTLPAVLEILQYYGKYYDIPNLDCAVPKPGCKAVKGSGLGANYITPEFAAKIQALNNIVNQGIDDAASAAHVPLVDINVMFHGLASGDPSNPYFKLAASIEPGVCCTLGYRYPNASSSALPPGGILSFDGVHPSNSGYGLVAYEFIATINKAYGTHIPQIDLHGVYAGTRCSNRAYCFPDPYAAHY
jgi:lysophospholipase L1-like esterase